MTAILAIDPGKTGALAFMNGDALDVIDMPATIPDIGDKLAWLEGGGSGRRFCLIEKQQAMPKQGLSSTFKLARHYGHLEAFAIAYGWPLDFVTPAVWKKKMGLTGKDKNAAREMAQRLFPDTDAFNRVKDHGRAEAALLAVYARRHLL